MTATQGELADLSKYIFRAPRWYASVTFALVIAAVAGVTAFDTQYYLSDAWEGVFFIGVPTVVASLATTPIDEWLGGQLTYNRSSLLALTCEIVIVTILVIAGSVALLTGPEFGQRFVFRALTAGLALVFAIRLVVVLAVSRNSWLAIVPASLQTVTGAVLLFVYSGTMRYLEIGGPLLRSYLSRPDEAPPELLIITPEDFVLLGAASVLYAAAAYGLVWMIDRPWQRSLGVSVLDFARGFVGHIAEGSRELEEFFEEIGEEAVVPVTVLAFRRLPEDDEPGSEKARFVLPMIHPGPMGEIGGGNLPRRIAETTEGLAFPPHATAGHDFNLVTSREVDTLVEAAERAHDDVEYSATATPSARSEAGEASVIGQAFGDDGLFAATFSPAFADDIEYSVGLSAAAEARVAGLDDVLLVDAHNCNNGLEGDDLGHVYPGSERSFDMMQAVGDVADRLAASDQGALRLGVAWDPTEWGPTDGIGPLGVRVAVAEVESGDDAADRQTTAYVLVDGNNMEPGLRDRIVDAVDAVDEVEVMTTDTHIVNTVESINQVGGAIGHERLVGIVEDTIATAVADLEPVEVGMATERAEVTVFGNDRTETLASQANSVVAMGGAAAAAVVLATVALSALLFFLA